MLETFPYFVEKIEIQYINIESDKVNKEFGELTVPVLILNDVIFSEGHVPIIKKLCREIIDSMKD